MPDYVLGAVESRFADLIWAHEPIASGALVRLCETELNWKKPTTYTVLRKLCARGIFQNDNGTVTALLSRREFYARQSEEYVEGSFGGSLPAFLTAFTARKPLSEAEIDELQALIDAHRR